MYNFHLRIKTFFFAFVFIFISIECPIFLKWIYIPTKMMVRIWVIRNLTWECLEILKHYLEQNTTFLIIQNYNLHYKLNEQTSKRASSLSRGSGPQNNFSHPTIALVVNKQQACPNIRVVVWPLFHFDW